MERYIGVDIELSINEAGKKRICVFNWSYMDPERIIFWPNIGHLWSFYVHPWYWSLMVDDKNFYVPANSWNFHVPGIGHLGAQERLIHGHIM